MYEYIVGRVLANCNDAYLQTQCFLEQSSRMTERQYLYCVPRRPDGLKGAPLGGSGRDGDIAAWAEGSVFSADELLSSWSKWQPT